LPLKDEGRAADNALMGFDRAEQWGKVEIPETLVGRPAGGSAREKARALRRQAPLRAVVSRVVGAHTDERAWSKGASGERWTARWLGLLSKDWVVLNDIPVGDRGANIDHVVIGRCGVFTVNAKQLSGKVWVGARSFLHNGYRTDYLPKATHEAERAARLLTDAVGGPVQVRACLAVFADDITIKQQPADVLVASPRSLRSWLLAAPQTLTPRAVTEIAAAAAKPTTWRGTAGRLGASCSCGGTVVLRRRKKDGHGFLGCSRFPSCRRTWSA